MFGAEHAVPRQRGALHHNEITRTTPVEREGRVPPALARRGRSRAAVLTLPTCSGGRGRHLYKRHRGGRNRVRWPGDGFHHALRGLIRNVSNSAPRRRSASSPDGQRRSRRLAGHDRAPARAAAAEAASAPRPRPSMAVSDHGEDLHHQRRACRPGDRLRQDQPEAGARHQPVLGRHGPATVGRVYARQDRPARGTRPSISSTRCSYARRLDRQ